MAGFVSWLGESSIAPGPVFSRPVFATGFNRWWTTHPPFLIFPFPPAGFSRTCSPRGNMPPIKPRTVPWSFASKFRSSSTARAPKAHPNSSPGQRPGYAARVGPEPCKGDTKFRRTACIWAGLQPAGVCRRFQPVVDGSSSFSYLSIPFSWSCSRRGDMPPIKPRTVPWSFAIKIPWWPFRWRTKGASQPQPRQRPGGIRPT